MKTREERLKEKNLRRLKGHKRNLRAIKKKNFIEQKRIEGDKSIMNRLEYKEVGLTKIKLVRANNSPVKLSSPKNIHFFPKPQKNRATFKINKNNWRAEINGKDFVVLKGDLLQMHETFYKTQGKMFSQVFFN